MYGLVNYGIKKMISEGFGVDVWENVLKESGVKNVFEKAENYPDVETVKLAGAVCGVLNMELPDVLHAYGKWWIGFAQEDYSQLFTKAGSSFKEFLMNMNETHRRVGYMFPESIAPRFTFEEVDSTTLKFYYISQREEFYPFVTGLIEGLGEAFNTKVEIDYRGKVEGEQGELFYITY